MKKKRFYKRRVSLPISVGIISFLFIAVVLVSSWYWKDLEIMVKEFSKVELLNGEEETELDSSVLLPEGFSKDKKEEVIEDLNGDGFKEIILTSVNDNNVGYLVVATIKNNKFEKVGEFRYEESYRGVLSVIKFEDIDNDGEKEIFLSLATGGASTSAEGILDVDFDNKKVDWVAMKDNSGENQKALFYVGAAVTHHHIYKIKDINQDSNKEIVTIDSWFEQEEPTDLEEWDFVYLINSNPGEEWRRCEIRVFEWDGNYFSYSGELINRIDKLEFEEICAP